MKQNHPLSEDDTYLSDNANTGPTAYWVNVPLNGDTITFNKLATYNYNQYISGIEINGVLLVDHSSIGVDDSGKGNNFLDHNYVVGNTSQVWSSTCNLTGGDNAIQKLFDTSVEGSGNGVASGANGAKITFSDLTASKFEVWCDSSVLWYGFNTSSYTEYTGTLPGWVTVYDGVPTSVNSFAWSFTSGGGTGCRIDAFKADNKLLIDANIADTVADTPMNNYAVARTGINGNLNLNNSQNASRATIPFAEGEKYYYETVVNGGTTNVGVSNDGFDAGIDNGGGSSNLTITSGNTVPFANGDVMGVAGNANKLSFFKNGEFILEGKPTIDSTNLTFSSGGGIGEDSTVNFGQQTFAGTNVTDNGDGTVTLPTALPNTSEDWTNSVTNNFYRGEAANLFKGGLETGGDDETAAWAENVTLSMLNGLSIEAKTLEVRANSIPGSTVWSVNGSQVEDDQTGQWKWIKLTGWTSPITQITALDPQHANTIAAIKIDGRILVTADPTKNTSQVWSNYLTVVAKGNDAYPGTDATFYPGYGPEMLFQDSRNQATGYICQYSPGDSQVWLYKFAPPESITINTLQLGSYYNAGDSLVEIFTSNTGLESALPVTYSTDPANSNLPLATVTFDVPYVCNADNPIYFGLDLIGAFQNWQYIPYMTINGRLLVNAAGFPGGTFKKLQQSWSEWVVVTLRRKGAEADALKRHLIASAVDWTPGTIYAEGQVVHFYDDLFIANTEVTSLLSPRTEVVIDEETGEEASSWTRLNIHVAPKRQAQTPTPTPTATPEATPEPTPTPTIDFGQSATSGGIS